MISRRDFLSRLAGGMAAGGMWCTVGSVSFKIRDVKAQSTPGNVLVMVFQRGGADGLYLVAPYGEDEYYNLRPDVHVDRPSGSDPNSAIPLGTMSNVAFGLNPNLEPMMEIYDAGDLAIVPATHLRGSGRSHFDNQAWIGHGEIRGSNTGWMAKLLQQSQNFSVFRGLTAGDGSLTHELEGAEAFPAIVRTSDYGLGGDEWCVDDGCQENVLLNHLRAAYGETDQAGLAVNDLTEARGLTMIDSLTAFGNLDPDYMATAGGLDYSNSKIGRGLRLVAQLIKADLPVECISVDWTGGWDSHNQQRPRGTGIVNSNSNLHRTQRDGAQNLLAFHRDMNGFWNRICMLIGSEFGRTSRQNGSFGTDHGYAACWWMMGGMVQGGRLHGGWPMLDRDNLQNGRFLDASVDCRDLMAEAIVRHLGYPESVLSSVFPGHTFQSQNIISTTA